MIEMYNMCVEFMINFANMLNISYRDANMIILFVCIPSIIAIDFILFIFLSIKRLFRHKFI